MTEKKKIAVVLFQLGGPDSPAAVEPFLYNLFCDPDIINFFGAWFARRPLARYIARNRAGIVREHYDAIGGHSPIRLLTERQARALEVALAPRFDAKCFIAMRYWNPLTAEAVAEVTAWNAQELVLLPMYPQFSFATTSSSLKEWQRLFHPNGNAPQTRTVKSFFDHPLYVDAIVEKIALSLTHFDEPGRAHIVFSAHGLPLSLIERGDPYAKQVEETVRLVMQRGGWENAHTLCYQSKVGRRKWLSPSLTETLDRLVPAGDKNLLVVPIAFVTEHIETLHEINIEAREQAHTLGVEQFEMMPAVGDSPTFIFALADLVIRSLAESSPEVHMSAEVNGRVIVTRSGGPETLQYIEEDIPEPGPGEVRVKVLAAGVSFADVLMRRGLYPGTPPPPFTPGYDIVGEIDKLGVGASKFSPGQQVGAMIVRGGYSKYAIVPEEYLVPVPEGVDPAEAVCMILNYTTAYQMLHRIARAGKGQRILIHGAAGGVGTALLQLGAIAGLTMYATASKSKHAVIASSGATLIDYRTEDFAKRIREITSDGVDCVFDAVGGMNWWRSYRVLRPKGILVCYGVSAAVVHGKLAGAASFLLMGALRAVPDGRRCVWYNITNLRKQRPDWFREDLAILFDMLAQRKVQPIIAARLPLREAVQANQWIEHAEVIGKIVLLCQQ